MQLAADGHSDPVLVAHDWIPERLAFAREVVGLNRSELADRLGLSASAVSQFEKGRTCPGPDTIARMAYILNVPVGSFGRPMSATIPLDTCRFTVQKGVSQVQRRRVTRLGALLTWLLDELGEEASGPRRQFDELRTKLVSECDIERMAATARDHLGLGQGPVTNMIRVMEEAGVVVVGWPGMATGSFAGWRSDGLPVAFLDIGGLPPSRLRFEAAIQLSRLLLDNAGRSPQEEDAPRAEAMAGAFLMPEEAFASERPARLNWSHLRALKRRWGVSIEDMLRRAFHLSLISESTFRRRSSQLNKKGWKGHEPDEPWQEYPTRVLRTVESAVESGMDLSQVAMAVGVSESLLQGLLAGCRPQPSLVVGF